MIKNDSVADGMAPRLNWSGPGSSSNIFILLALFVIMFAVFSFSANNFLTVGSILNLLVQTSTFTILSIGSALVLVIGEIDFSPGAVIALSGTAVVVFAVMGLPIWIAMSAACLLGGIVGLVNGLLVARVHLPSFLTTFATGVVIYGILGGLAVFVAHNGPPPPVPDSLGGLANNPIFKILSHDANGTEIVVFPGVSWIIIIMLGVAVLSHLFLQKTRFGRYAYLVGCNTEASRFSGIKVLRVKIMAFVFSGVLAGLVGVLLASRLGGAPGGAVGYEIIGITCAMIGGASLSGGSGSIGGTVIGSFLLSTLAMGLTMMNADQVYLPMLLNGLVLLGAVYLDRQQNTNWRIGNIRSFQ